jgi:hypothetical protein
MRSKPAFLFEVIVTPTRLAPVGAETYHFSENK